MGTDFNFTHHLFSQRISDSQLLSWQAVHYLPFVLNKGNDCYYFMKGWGSVTAVWGSLNQRGALHQSCGPQTGVSSVYNQPVLARKSARAEDWIRGTRGGLYAAMSFSSDLDSEPSADAKASSALLGSPSSTLPWPRLAMRLSLLISSLFALTPPLACYKHISRFCKATFKRKSVVF